MGQVEKLGHATAWGRVHPGSPQAPSQHRGSPRPRGQWEAKMWNQHWLDGTATSHAPHRKDGTTSTTTTLPPPWATAQKSTTLPYTVMRLLSQQLKIQ